MTRLKVSIHATFKPHFVIIEISRKGGMAYRWFLGLELYDAVPHFSTFGKNYTRRFKGTDLFEQIFQHILEECYQFKLVDPSDISINFVFPLLLFPINTQKLVISISAFPIFRKSSTLNIVVNLT